ncbi:hypothetical protein [Streptomyces sp. NPDC059639]|uniref:hypothetical protein n=1 Tax=Streptomyces sp. NPDC059639 TaxID=3346891 RepID=UPI003685A416
MTSQVPPTSPSSSPPASSPSPPSPSPVPPSTSSPGRGSRLLFRGFGVALLVAGLFLGWYGFSTAAMSTGVVGTRGELTISTCETQYGSTGSRRHSVGVRHSTKDVKRLTCEGVVRSGGDVVDGSARLVLSGRTGSGDRDTIDRIREQNYDQGYRKGYAVAVNRAPDSTLYVTSWTSVSNCLFLGFLAVLLLGLGFFCVTVRNAPEKSDAGPFAWRSTTLLWLGGIGGVGLVLSVVFRVLLMAGDWLGHLF